MKKTMQIVFSVLLLATMISACRRGNMSETTAPTKESTSQTETTGTTGTTGTTETTGTTHTTETTIHGEMSLPTVIGTMPEPTPVG